MDTETPQKEWPRYKCHKEVHAVKIAAIDRDQDSDACVKGGRETDGSAMITPADEGFAPFKVDSSYLRKHNPQVGDYYVFDAGDSESFSPAKAFENGYTRI